MFTSTCAVIARSATSSATMRVEMIQMKCFRFIYACARYVFVCKGTHTVPFLQSTACPEAAAPGTHTLVTTAALDSNGHRCLVGSFRNNYCLRSHPVLAPRYSGMQGACGASNFQKPSLRFYSKTKTCRNQSRRRSCSHQHTPTCCCRQISQGHLRVHAVT